MSPPVIGINNAKAMAAITKRSPTKLILSTKSTLSADITYDTDYSY